MTIKKRTLILYFSFSYSLKERLIVEPELGCHCTKNGEEHCVRVMLLQVYTEITQAKEQKSFHKTAQQVMAIPKSEEASNSTGHQNTSKTFLNYPKSN